MTGHTPAAPLSSRIASLVHAHFDALPTRSKPTIFPDGSREWIPMTGIVAVKSENTTSESLHCIAITTGAKCLSASHIPRCRGLVLHDCHAEILAIRAFNYWLLTECHGILIEEKTFLGQSPKSINTEQTGILSSPFIRRRNRLDAQTDTSTSSIDWPPFEIQPDVNIYMYCTCAPCGDASMELCMAAQEDATPWEVTRLPDVSSEVQEEDILLDGRAHFSLLGVVRRKPARMDAESTRSKSCSDKLALRQVSSLLSTETCRLVAPTENAYLAGLILPEDEISRVGFERSFGANGRMQALAGRSWPGTTSSDCTYPTTGFRFRPFQVLSVPTEEVETLWRFAKPKPTTDPDVAPAKSKPGNVSAVWTAASSYPHQCVRVSGTGSKYLPALRRTPTGLYETIINGVKQGNKAFPPRPRGAPSLSRARMWELLQDIIVPDACLDTEQQEGSSGIDAAEGSAVRWMQHRVQRASTYEELKRAGNERANPLRVRGEAIRDARAVLKGWVHNAGDEDWGLGVLIDTKKRKR